MTDTAWTAIQMMFVAFVASVPATVAAFAAWRQGQKNGVEAKSTTVKVDDLAVQSAKISEATDGNLSALTAKLEAALEHGKTSDTQLVEVRALLSKLIMKDAAPLPPATISVPPMEVTGDSGGAVVVKNEAS